MASPRSPGEQVFALHMIQARDPSLVGTAVLRRITIPDAVWLSDLRPAFADRFPFDPSGSDRADGECWDVDLLASAG